MFSTSEALGKKEQDALPRRRLSRWVPLLAGAVCLSPFVPLLTHSHVIISGPERDYAIMHIPLAEFIRDELLCGRLPLWNPYIGCGQPLHAAQQAMLFYPPPTILCLMFGANAGLKASVFLHLAVCYAGVCLLALRTGLSYYSAAYAAFTATWSGALMGHLAEGHVGLVHEMAIVPWFFLGLDDFIGKAGPLPAIRLAAIGSLSALAGHPQVPYYLLLAATVWVAGSLLRGRSARHRASTICWGVIAAAISVLIAGVQLVPLSELVLDGLGESARGTTTYASTFALNGADAARLLMPHLNGTPFAGVPQFDAADHYHERVIYLGMSVPLLVVYGITRGHASVRRWALASGVVLALAIAFADNTPAFDVLHRALPGLLNFRCPGRIFSVATLPAVLLAARGLDALASGEPRGNRIELFGSAVFVLTATGVPIYAGLELLDSFDWRQYLDFARANLCESMVIWCLLVLDILLVFVLALLRLLRGTIVVMTILTISVLDLGYFNVVNVRLDTPDANNASIPPNESTTRFVEALSFEHISYDALCYSGLTASAIRAHRPALGTYDGGVLPAATARLYQAVDANTSRVLALAACRFAWSTAGTSCENPAGALPRFRFVSGTADLLDLPIKDVTDSELETWRQHGSTLALLKEEPRCLELQVNVGEPGWLIIADTYYPGWVCEVNGDARQIESLDGIFRRVWLTPGQHVVVMRYEPISFQLGVGSTLGGLASAAAVCFLRLARR